MRIGIIICGRYHNCDGGKCFRAVRNREGAFRRYPKDEPLEVVAYTYCGGCPGGNIEATINGIKKYGAEAIHFATGVLAGYPPCKYLATHKKFTEEQTGLPVIIGTHPMPTNYIKIHEKAGDWTQYHMDLMEEFELLIPEEAEKYDSTKVNYGTELEEELKE
ncbi:MAG: CGGC domain-containing protein [Promethearchaeota archaeon]|nr:MAG: CGGC domain-containing protein [Candidatus Lokiarchaeota archaeon]